MSNKFIGFTPKLRINTDQAGRFVIEYKNARNLFSKWITLRNPDDYFDTFDSLDEAKVQLNKFKKMYGVNINSFPKVVYIVARYDEDGNLVYDDAFVKESEANHYVKNTYGEHYISNGLATIIKKVFDK